MATLPNPASLVEKDGMRFLIFDAPSDNNIANYVLVLQEHGVTDVVRVCDPTYSPKLITDGGMAFKDWPFKDGEAPPQSTVENWLALVDDVFSDDRPEGPGTIGIHCVAGLGRAPVLVAVALIEKGMSYEEAVELIRSNRRGALNRTQLNYLEEYSSSKSGCSCTIL